MNLKKLAMAALAAATVLTNVSVWAATVSNRLENHAGSAPIMGSVLYSSAFQVANGQDYELTDIQLSLFVAASNPRMHVDETISPTIEAWIYSNVSNKPGGVLEQLTSLGSGAFSSNGLNLTAGGTYWVVVGDFKGVSFWYTTFSGNESGDAGWSISNNSYASTNSGATWGSPGSSTNQFAVNAVPIAAPVPAPVPEPSTLALMALGGLALLRRRPSA